MENLETYIAFDLEFNTVDGVSHIIQVSAVKMDQHKEVGQFDSFVYSDVPLQSFINGLTGITADKIASEAEFFSFGTNDLTQMLFGLSRDDSGKIIKTYMNNKVALNGKEVTIMEKDPFLTLDMGVVELMKLAIQKGRAVRPGLKVGICGEHGGDPQSIEYSNDVGVDYVSCSPFRVPIARLAAAKGALNKEAK